LKKDFERYGPIKQLRVVRNEETGASRRYAFIEFESEKSMKGVWWRVGSSRSYRTEAYKDADGLRIDQSKILVDVERSRTVRGWIPRRCGGGLGGKPLPIAPPPLFVQ
jgi:U1 small nuclear ribonucleoprotein